MKSNKGVVTGLPLDLKQKNSYDEIAKFLSTEWRLFLKKENKSFKFEKISNKPTLGMIAYSSLDEKDERKKHLLIGFSNAQDKSNEIKSEPLSEVQSDRLKFIEHLNKIKPNWWKKWECSVGEIELVTSVNITEKGMAHKYGFNDLRCAAPSITELKELPKFIKKGEDNGGSGRIFVYSEEVYIEHKHAPTLLIPQPDKKLIQDFCAEDSLSNRKSLAYAIEKIVSEHRDKICKKLKTLPSFHFLFSFCVDLNDKNIHSWKRGDSLGQNVVVITKNPIGIFIKTKGKFEPLTLKFNTSEQKELDAFIQSPQKGREYKTLERIIKNKILLKQENLVKDLWKFNVYRCAEPKLAAEREKIMLRERGYMDEDEFYFFIHDKYDDGISISRQSCCPECVARANDFRILLMNPYKDKKDAGSEEFRPPSPCGMFKFGEAKVPSETSVDWYMTQVNFQLNEAKKLEKKEGVIDQRRRELFLENSIVYCNQAIYAISEKKLLRADDIFKLAALYKHRAVQLKVLGLEYQKDLAKAKEFSKVIEQVKLEGQHVSNEMGAPLLVGDVPLVEKQPLQSSTAKKESASLKKPAQKVKVISTKQEVKETKMVNQEVHPKMDAPSKMPSIPHSNHFDCFYKDTDSNTKKRLFKFKESDSQKKKLIKKEKIVSIDEVIDSFFGEFTRRLTYQQEKITNLEQVKNRWIKYFEKQKILNVQKNKIDEIHNFMHEALTTREESSWIRFFCCRKKQTILVLDESCLTEHLRI